MMGPVSPSSSPPPPASLLTAPTTAAPATKPHKKGRAENAPAPPPSAPTPSAPPPSAPASNAGSASAPPALIQKRGPRPGAPNAGRKPKDVSHDPKKLAKQQAQKAYDKQRNDAKRAAAAAKELTTWEAKTAEKRAKELQNIADSTARKKEAIAQGLLVPGTEDKQREMEYSYDKYTERRLLTGWIKLFLWLEQDGKCAGCGGPLEDLILDCNHAFGKKRFRLAKSSTHKPSDTIREAPKTDLRHIICHKLETRRQMKAGEVKFGRSGFSKGHGSAEQE